MLLVFFAWLPMSVWLYLPETSSKLAPQKNGFRWNTFSFPFGALPIFRGEMALIFSV